MGAEGVARGEDGIELAAAAQAGPLPSSLSCLKELLPSANTRTFLALKLQNGGWINSEDRPWGGKRQPRPQEPSSVFWVPCFCLGILQQGWKQAGVCFREAMCTSQGARGSAPKPRSSFIGSCDEQLLEGQYPTLYFYLSHHKAPVS